MLRIKRTKGGAVHYATAVAPRGSIDGWHKSEHKAVAVTDGVAKRVRDFHCHRQNVGELAFEPVNVDGATLAQAVAADDAIGAAEFATLQAECKRLREIVAEQDKEGQKAVAVAREAERRYRESASLVRDLEEALEAKSDEIALLKARVSDLEAMLAKATEPAATETAGTAPFQPQQPQGGKKK